MRDTCPVHYEERLNLWVVTRYEDVETVLRDPATFSSAGAVTTSAAPLPTAVQAVLARGTWPLTLLTESDPPIHRRLRSLVQKAFTPRRVRSLEPVMDQRARALVDGFRSRGEVEIISAFAWPLPVGVIGLMLGVEPERAEDLHRWSRDLLLLLQGADDEETLIRRAESVVAMQQYFADALTRRRTVRRDDLMGALLEGWDPAMLSFAELVQVPVNLIVAGHLTVTRAIGTGLVLLDRHGMLSGLAWRARAGRLDAIVEEVLRLETPAQGLFRRVTRDTTLGGVALQTGARVMVHFGAANRDDRVFGHADEFDAEREEISRHVAFGKGAHFCLGAPLARTELRIALSTLGVELPGLRVAPDRTTRRDPIFFARGYEELHVAWDTDVKRAGLSRAPRAQRV
jgi:cytochrome P450